MSYEIKPANEIKRGSIGIIYGDAGVGKTILASKFPKPIFIQTKEGGLREISADAFPATENFDDFVEQLRAVYKIIKDSSNYKTLVIDTATSVNSMIIDDVLEKDKLSDGSKSDSLESYGWNRGYELIMKRWMQVISILKKLADFNVNIVIIAHSTMSKYKTPTGVEFGRYDVDITHRENASSREILIRNCDFVFFMKKEMVSATKGSGRSGKTVAASNSIEPDRVLYCEERAAFRAKHRHGMKERYEINRDDSNIDEIIEKLALDI